MERQSNSNNLKNNDILKDWKRKMHEEQLRSLNQKPFIGDVIGNALRKKLMGINNFLNPKPSITTELSLDDLIVKALQEEREGLLRDAIDYYYLIFKTCPYDNNSFHFYDDLNSYFDLEGLAKSLKVLKCESDLKDEKIKNLILTNNIKKNSQGPVNVFYDIQSAISIDFNLASFQEDERRIDSGSREFDDDVDKSILNVSKTEDYDLKFECKNNEIRNNSHSHEGIYNYYEQDFNNNLKENNNQN